MKAVILAGGEGTRLRPLTLERPKPMVPLFGRPVLEHILLLLRRNGFDQVALSLRYLPQVVRDYFGDGSAWGMELHYFVEQDPLGTAGGVKGAEAFLGDEDFLVFSGDCVCDFDLKDCYERHKARGALATLLLHREKDPLEYGLVQLGRDNRVARFLEKPGWGQVFTNLVNTGIYFLSPEVLREIPADTPYDFSRELFPKLLSAGKALYGDTPYGYWRDMGDTGAYLQAAADALDGKVKLDLLLPQVKTGVWCASPIPESCAIVPPCWIAERVTIGESCLIGPHTVLEQGTYLGERTVAQRSILLGCAVGSSSTLHGAILCEDSTVGTGCSLAQGSVLGAEAVLEDQVVLREEVRIWPRIPVKAGSRLTSSVTGGAVPVHVCFEGGAIRGKLAQEITPELLLTLGSVLGRSERVALGATPGAGCAALLMAAAAGVSAAGSVPLVHDGSTWGSAAYLARRGGADCSLFIEGRGDQCLLWVFDRQGLPPGPRRGHGPPGTGPGHRRRLLRRGGAGGGQRPHLPADGVRPGGGPGEPAALPGPPEPGLQGAPGPAPGGARPLVPPGRPAALWGGRAGGRPSAGAPDADGGPGARRGGPDGAGPALGRPRRRRNADGLPGGPARPARKVRPPGPGPGGPAGRAVCRLSALPPAGPHRGAAGGSEPPGPGLRGMPGRGAPGGQPWGSDGGTGPALAPGGPGPGGAAAPPVRGLGLDQARRLQRPAEDPHRGGQRGGRGGAV